MVSGGVEHSMAAAEARMKAHKYQDAAAKSVKKDRSALKSGSSHQGRLVMAPAVISKKDESSSRRRRSSSSYEHHHLLHSIDSGEIAEEPSFYTLSALNFGEKDANVPGKLLKYHFSGRYKDAWGSFDLPLGGPSTTGTTTVPLSRHHPPSRLLVTVADWSQGVAAKAMRHAELHDIFPASVRKRRKGRNLLVEVSRSVMNLHQRKHLLTTGDAASFDRAILQLFDISASTEALTMAERAHVLEILNYMVLSGEKKEDELNERITPERQAALLRILLRVYGYDPSSFGEVQTSHVLDLLEMLTLAFPASKDGTNDRNMDMYMRPLALESAVHLTSLLMESLLPAQGQVHDTRIARIVDQLARAGHSLALKTVSQEDSKLEDKAIASSTRFISPNLYLQFERLLHHNSAEGRSRRLSFQMQDDALYYHGHENVVLPGTIGIVDVVKLSKDLLHRSTDASAYIQAPSAGNAAVAEANHRFLSVKFTLYHADGTLFNATKEGLDTVASVSGESVKIPFEISFKPSSTNSLDAVSMMKTSEEQAELRLCDGPTSNFGTEYTIVCGVSAGVEDQTTKSIHRIQCKNLQPIPFQCPPTTQCYQYDVQKLMWTKDNCNFTSSVEDSDDATVGKCLCTPSSSSLPASVRTVDIKYHQVRTRMLQITSSDSHQAQAPYESALEFLLAGLYGVFLVVFTVALVIHRRRQRKREHEILEATRDSRFYTDVLRHLRRTSSRKAKGLADVMAPPPPSVSGPLDGSFNYSRSDSMGSSFLSNSATGELETVVNTDSPGASSNSNHKKKGIDSRLEDKRPDLEYVVQTVVGAKLKKLDAVVLLPRSQSYRSSLLGGDVRQLSFLQTFFMGFLLSLTLLALGALFYDKVATTIAKNTAQGMLMVALWALIQAFILVVCAKILHNCLSAVNKRMTLRTTLQDAVLEKELRYRDPLQYIDQPDVYINSLQLALVQLNLVQKVLKVDYKAAMKDFRASRREVKPTMKDIVASREEIKENQLRLATLYANKKEQLQESFLRQLAGRAFSPEYDNPLISFDEETRVSVAFNEWALTQCNKAGGRNKLRNSLLRRLYKETFSDFDSAFIDGSDRYSFLLLDSSSGGIFRNQGIEKRIQLIESCLFYMGFTVRLFFILSYILVLTLFVVWQAMRHQYEASRILMSTLLASGSTLVMYTFVLVPILAVGKVLTNSFASTIKNTLQDNLKDFMAHVTGPSKQPIDWMTMTSSTMTSYLTAAAPSGFSYHGSPELPRPDVHRKFLIHESANTPPPVAAPGADSSVVRLQDVRKSAMLAAAASAAGSFSPPNNHTDSTASSVMSLNPINLPSKRAYINRAYSSNDAVDAEDADDNLPPHSPSSSPAKSAFIWQNPYPSQPRVVNKSDEEE